MFTGVFAFQACLTPFLFKCGKLCVSALRLPKHCRNICRNAETRTAAGEQQTRPRSGRRGRKIFQPVSLMPIRGQPGRINPPMVPCAGCFSLGVGHGCPLVGVSPIFHGGLGYPLPVAPMGMKGGAARARVHLFCLARAREVATVRPAAPRPRLYGGLGTPARRRGGSGNGGLYPLPPHGAGRRQLHLPTDDNYTYPLNR